MAKTKRSPKGDAYANDFGQCLFDAVLDAYDVWLSGIPYVQPGTANSVSVHTHDELAENVWPPVEKLCIRLEAYGQGALGARVERAYKDAQDYARIIDDYCLSNKFDFWLWKSGDPASDHVETDNAGVAELLSKADSINEWDLTGGFYGVNRPEWVSAIAAQAVQSEIVKYGHPPTKDYSERAERWALECFWLAVQLCKRDMDDHEARQYLEQYLSKRMVVSETKDPIIHEALGRAFGTHIYRLDPQDAAEKGSALPAVVVEAQEVLIVRLRDQETRAIEVAHMAGKKEGTEPMSEANKTETILTDLRATLADLLSNGRTRERFREKVAAWCKRLVESDKPGSVRVDTGIATCFGSVGSLAMIAALMSRGPQNLDEAYVLLGALHDSGPHVGRAGKLAQPEWDLEVRSQWDNVIGSGQLPGALLMLTPDAVQRLAERLENVKKDCAAVQADVRYFLMIHCQVGKVVFWSEGEKPMFAGPALRSMAPHDEGPRAFYSTDSKTIADHLVRLFESKPAPPHRCREEKHRVPYGYSVVSEDNMDLLARTRAKSEVDSVLACVNGKANTSESDDLESGLSLLASEHRRAHGWEVTLRKELNIPPKPTAQDGPIQEDDVPERGVAPSGSRAASEGQAAKAAEVYRRTERELQEAIRSGDGARIMARVREIAGERQWAAKQVSGKTTAGDAPYEQALASGDQYIDVCFPAWGDSQRTRFKEALRHLNIRELDEVIVMLTGWYLEQQAAAEKPQTPPAITDMKSGGNRPAWQPMAEIEEQVKKLAPTDYSILLLGETGTGKEYLARRIHNDSQRNTAPFVAANCPSLPKDRIDAELYGYEKGAFTGADKPYPGRIREAAGGTVFLDEIGDLPPECWGNLLRFLQSREISPLREKAVTVNVRVLAATNRPGRVPLEGLHRFDHQLYLPPLRERRKDILEIVEGFFESAKSENNRTSLRLAQAEREKLAGADYDWPGNIRQLEKATKRAVLLHATGRDVTAQEILDAAKAVANLT